MSRDQKIEKINAYKKMLETKRLPKIDDQAKAGPQNPDDPSTWPVEEQIHAEFTQWAEGQLANLLGEGLEETPEGFTFDEVMVLKQFAQKTLARASNPPPAPATPEREPVHQAPRQAPPPQNRTSNQGYPTRPDIQPLGNRKIQSQQQKQQQSGTVDPYLKQLEDMDRQSPEY